MVKLVDWQLITYDNTETRKESSARDCSAFHVLSTLTVVFGCTFFLWSWPSSGREMWQIYIWCCLCVISLIMVYTQLLVWSRILSCLLYFELFPIPSWIPKRTEKMWYLIEQCLEEPKRQAPISITESLHDSWRAPAHCDMFEITLPMTGELCWYQYNSKKLHFMLRIQVIIKMFVIWRIPQQQLWRYCLLACDTWWSLL